MVAIAGDHLVGITLGHLHSDDDRFLTDIEVAESADQAHAVHLAGFLLEAPDQEHLPQRLEFLLLAEFRDCGARSRRRARRAAIVLLHALGLGDSHSASFAKSREKASHSRNRPMAEVGGRRMVPTAKRL